MDTEKERLLAEGNAAMEARRAEAEAESKRKRDLEREKARQALQEVSEWSTFAGAMKLIFCLIAKSSFKPDADGENCRN